MQEIFIEIINSNGEIVSQKIIGAFINKVYPIYLNLVTGNALIFCVYCSFKESNEIIQTVTMRFNNFKKFNSIPENSPFKFSTSGNEFLKLSLNSATSLTKDRIFYRR